MKGKAFIDTNVLVYLFSTDEPVKQKQISSYLKELSADHLLVWSTQIAQEFYQVMTSKLKQDPIKVKEMLGLFYPYELVVNNMNTIEGAIDIQVLYRYSFWDSMVISAALQANCQKLVSEDLTNGQQMKGLQVVNPLA